MSQSGRLNVLAITADDQRFDTISRLGLGTDSIVTPHLDCLIEDGCALIRAHNMGSDHGAVCVPARSMIHSSRSLFHLDRPGRMATDHPTLPEAFGNAGYWISGTGKWHNGQKIFNRCYGAGIVSSSAAWTTLERPGQFPRFIEGDLVELRTREPEDAEFRRDYVNHPDLRTVIGTRYPHNAVYERAAIEETS